MKQLVIDNRVKKRGKSGIPLYVTRFLETDIKGYEVFESTAMSLQGKLGVLLEFVPNPLCELNPMVDTIINVNNNVPVIVNPFKKRVVVIHDFGPVLFPELYSFFARIFFKIGLFFALNYSTKILLISNTVQKDFKRLYPQYHYKVGVNHNFVLDQELRNMVSSGYDDEKYFVIFAGTARRKNVYGLLKSLNAVANKSLNFRLKLIGNLQIHEFTNLKIEIHENVPDDKLNAIMYYSDGLIYPSLYEGFGYPLLHAMAYTKRIFCGSIPINTEILEGYEDVHYFDVQNFNDINEVYQKLLDAKARHPQLVKMHRRYTKAAFEQKMSELLK